MEDVGSFYGNLVYFTAIWSTYFTAIWYILWPFGTFHIFGIFFRYDNLYQEKNLATLPESLFCQILSTKTRKKNFVAFASMKALGVLAVCSFLAQNSSGQHLFVCFLH
jgi:hypothetical protein